MSILKPDRHGLDYGYRTPIIEPLEWPDVLVNPFY